MKCKVCGHDNSEDAGFCSQCGAKLELEEKEKRFCANCGAEVEGSFCSKCGAPAPVTEESTVSSEEIPESREEVKHYCKNCGAELDGQFCSNCGTRAGSSEMEKGRTEPMSETVRSEANDGQSTNSNDYKAKDGEIIGKTRFKRILRTITNIYDIAIAVIAVLTIIGVFDAMVVRTGQIVALVIVSFCFFGIIRFCEKKYYKTRNYTTDFNGFTIAQIIGLIVSVVVLIGILSSTSKEIDIVKNGYLDVDKNMTVGEALDRACVNEKWKYFKHDGDFVEFSGKYNDSKILIQFRIHKDSNTFNPVYAEINGESLSQEEFFVLIEEIYRNGKISAVGEVRDDTLAKNAIPPIYHFRMHVFV